MKHRYSIRAVIAIWTALFSSACDKGNGPDGTDAQVLDRHTSVCAWDSICDGSDLDICIRHLARSEALDIAMFPDLYESALQCMDQAKSCDDYWSCRFGGDPESCDVQTYQTHCDGSVLTRCRTYGLNDQYAAITKIDCAEVDMQCLQTDFGAICTTGACTQSTCDGNRALVCDDGYTLRVDCSRLDSVCAEGNCVDSDAAVCTRATCEGSNIKECYDGKTFSWDCAELVHQDSSCVLFHEEPFCGKPAEQQECDRSVESAWCDGDQANVCMYGMLVTVDCSEYDGAGCEAGQYAIHCSK